MRLIGISGKKRSGKDTVARALASLGYTRIAFADTLKEMVAAFLGKSLSEVFADEFKTQSILTIDDAVLTGRDVLQRMGVAARTALGTSVWIDAVFREMGSNLGMNYVIPDVRFRNEMRAIIDRGGIIIRLNRADGGEIDSHESETTLPDSAPEYSLIVEAETAESAAAVVTTWVKHFYSEKEHK